MANDCENTLYIEGTEEEIFSFIKENASQDETGEKVFFTFTASIPVQLKEKDNFYDWAVENWGTKWDAEVEEDWEYHDLMAQISFITAWCPPEEYIVTISKLYPNLTFTLQYVEHGLQFCGDIVANNGVSYNTDLDYENVYGVFCEECDDFCQNEDEHQIN